VLPTVYVVALFCVGSIHTSIDIPQDFIARDKANHFAAFGLLTLLCLRAFRQEWPNVGKRRLVVLAIATASIVGALLEIWQLMFPYRSSEVLDWVADTLGALLAGLIGYWWLLWRKRSAAARGPAA